MPARWRPRAVAFSVPIQAANPSGPWSYELADVPAFNNLKVLVTFEGSSGALPNHASGESAPFELKPNGSAAVRVQLKN